MLVCQSGLLIDSSVRRSVGGFVWFVFNPLSVGSRAHSFLLSNFVQSSRIVMSGLNHREKL